MLVLIVEFLTKELLKYSSVSSLKWFLECLVSECNSFSISLYLCPCGRHMNAVVNWLS